MSHSQIINCRVKAGEPKVTFSVENWPTSIGEALRLWGEKRCVHAIFGTSSIVQAQGFFRGLCTRKEKRLTVVKAREEMRNWKPSDGQRERVSKPEKARRVLSDMSQDEGVAFIVESFGVSGQEALKMFLNVQSLTKKAKGKAA